MVVGKTIEESLEEEDALEKAGERLRKGVGGKEDKCMHAEFAGDECMRSGEPGGVRLASSEVGREGDKCMRAEFAGDDCMRSGDPGGVRLASSEVGRAGGMLLSPKLGVFLGWAGGSGEGGRFWTLFDWRRARVAVGKQRERCGQ